MRVAIIGRTEILYETAELLAKRGHEIALIITAKAAPEYTRTEEDFKALAGKLSAPFVHTARIAESLETIRSLDPVDIGVSMNYPGVIPSEVIDLFSLGVLNAHGGDLPRYRGNACQAWAILNGEKRVGLCVHKMVGGELDSGDIIARDYRPLTAESTITEVYGWMASRTPDLFAQALDLLAADPSYVLERQSKKTADALRCYPRAQEDGYIDWNRSAVEILRLINASTKPYAGASPGTKARWCASGAPAWAPSPARAASSPDRCCGRTTTAPWLWVRGIRECCCSTRCRRMSASRARLRRWYGR